jgi:hypothetical protein
MAREGSKRAVAIEIMNSNAKKPMAEVLALISKANGIDTGAARSYYVYLVKQGMAKGTIESAPKAPKTAKEKAVKRMAKEVVVKAAKPKTKAEAVKAVAAKSPEEIEKIKAANMARMKAVLGKVKQNVVKDEVEAPAFAETDTFAAPAFLTKDEVTALV